MNFEFFLSLNLKFQISFDLNLQNWVLCTILYHYANFHDFDPRLLPQLSEKKIRAKNL